MTRRSNRSAWVGVLLAALATLNACGDDDPERDASVPGKWVSMDNRDTTEEVDAYHSWLDALEAHDAIGACARHAPDFTIALRQEAILQHRAELGDPCVGFVALLWEDPAREYEPTGIEVTQLTEEDALLAVDFPTVDETVRMERRHGSWYVASTEPRDEGGADPARWVEHWCDLSVGMDRGDVIGLMGEPSGEYTVDNGGEPQLWWADRQYDFRAYLNLDGSVLDLVGDYDRLEAADLEQLGCPELR